jgi:phage shock protein PspC (stress-responsive transcriptional regulator)
VRARRGDPVAMSEHTVEQSTVRRLERSRSDRMLAGVSGGLARYFDMHPAFYRVGFVVLTLIGGAGILIYLAAVLVIPDEGHEDSIAESVLRERRDRPWPLVGLGLVAVAGVALLGQATFWPNGDAAWVLLLLAGGTILWLTRRNPSPPEPREPAASPETEARTETLPRAVAAEDSRRMRRLGKAIAITVVAVVAALLIAAAVFAALLPLHLSHGIGERTYAVSDVGNLGESYSLGIGDLELDLTRLELPVGETHLRTRVDIGRLTVIVPADAALQARGEARFGEVHMLGDLSEGRDVDSSVSEDGDRILVLDAQVGAGELVVVRAVR